MQESTHVILVVEVKAFREELIGIFGKSPSQTTQALQKTCFRRQMEVLLEVINDLIRQQFIVINVLPHEREFQIEARTICLWIFHPSSVQQCSLQITISTFYNEHLSRIGKSLLLLPIREISHIRNRTRLPPKAILIAVSFILFILIPLHALSYDLR